MTSATTKPDVSQPTTQSNSHLFDDWFDPIETGIRDRVRELIEEMIREQGTRHPGHPRVARSSINHQNRGLHGLGAEPVQGFLAGLANHLDDRQGL
jgi:putative transposase